MKRLKLGVAMLAAVLLCVSCAACSIPMPGFADYDVSGYIKALLDSSYHGENEEFRDITGASEEDAKVNNTTTVENAAVNFCNVYGVSPSEAQMVEIQKVMRQAFSLTKYTVKAHQKTNTGYYLEVEIASISNFGGRKNEIDKLKAEAQTEATHRNQTEFVTSSEPAVEYYEDEYGNLYDEYGNVVEPSPSPSPSPSPEPTDANALFVEKVISFLKTEIANVVYESPVTISMDILQTEAGELQLDTNQLDTLDRTVIRFQ